MGRPRHHTMAAKLVAMMVFLALAQGQEGDQDIVQVSSTTTTTTTTTTTLAANQDTPCMTSCLGGSPLPTGCQASANTCQTGGCSGQWCGSSSGGGAGGGTTTP